MVDLQGGKKDHTLSVSVTEEVFDLFDVCAIAAGTDRSNKLNLIIIQYLNEEVRKANLVSKVIERQLKNI